MTRRVRPKRVHKPVHLHQGTETSCLEGSALWRRQHRWEERWKWVIRDASWRKWHLNQTKPGTRRSKSAKTGMNKNRDEMSHGMLAGLDVNRCVKPWCFQGGVLREVSEVCLGPDYAGAWAKLHSWPWPSEDLSWNRNPLEQMPGNPVCKGSKVVFPNWTHDAEKKE